MPLKVLRPREAFRTARHGTDVRALPRFIRLGHPTSAALLDEMRDGHRGQNALALCRLLGSSFRGWDHDDDGTGSGSRRWGPLIERWLNFGSADIFPGNTSRNNGGEGGGRCTMMVISHLKLCIHGAFAS